MHTPPPPPIPRHLLPALNLPLPTQRSTIHFLFPLILLFHHHKLIVHNDPALILTRAAICPARLRRCARLAGRGGEHVHEEGGEEGGEVGAGEVELVVLW